MSFDCVQSRSIFVYHIGRSRGGNCISIHDCLMFLDDLASKIRKFDNDDDSNQQHRLNNGWLIAISHSQWYQQTTEQV